MAENMESEAAKNRPTWIPDGWVSRCTSCRANFSVAKRKHHCRACGNIFCKDCSTHTLFLTELGYTTKPVRVCDNCFRKYDASYNQQQT